MLYIFKNNSVDIIVYLLLNRKKQTKVNYVSCTEVLIPIIYSLNLRRKVIVRRLMAMLFRLRQSDK